MKDGLDGESNQQRMQVSLCSCNRVMHYGVVQYRCKSGMALSPCLCIWLISYELKMPTMMGKRTPTDRQTDGQTDGQTDRHAGRQAVRQTQRHQDRQTNAHRSSYSRKGALPGHKGLLHHTALLLDLLQGLFSRSCPA